MNVALDAHALAWALAAVTKTFGTQLENDRINIAIGIGETFAAIDALITFIAQKRIPLSHDLTVSFTRWLDSYAGQDAEPRLRARLAEVITLRLDRPEPLTNQAIQTPSRTEHPALQREWQAPLAPALGGVIARDR